MRYALLGAKASAPAGVLGWSMRIAALMIVVVALGGVSSADAHPGHPQKKLFNGHWWRVDFGYAMDLTTSDVFYGVTDPGDPGRVCDGGVNVCILHVEVGDAGASGD